MGSAALGAGGLVGSAALGAGGLVGSAALGCFTIIGNGLLELANCSTIFGELLPPWTSLLGCFTIIGNEPAFASNVNTGLKASLTLVSGFGGWCLWPLRSGIAGLSWTGLHCRGSQR